MIQPDCQAHLLVMWCVLGVDKNVVGSILYSWWWEEVVGDALVCGTFPDLVYGFDVTRFSGRAHVNRNIVRLSVSSRSIFGGMGVVVKFLINFDILFGVLAERRKKYFWWISLMGLMSLCQS